MNDQHVTAIKRLKGIPNGEDVPTRRLLAAIIWRAALDATLPSLGDDIKTDAWHFLDSDFARIVGRELGIDISSQRLREHVGSGYEMPRLRR